VDDEEEVLDLVRHDVAESGYRVETAVTNPAHFRCLVRQCVRGVL